MKKEQEEIILDEIFEDEKNSEIEKISDLEKKCNEYENKWKYSVAELDNARKRFANEKKTLYESVLSNVVLKFLDLKDDLERATESNKKIDDVQALKDGYCTLVKKFDCILGELNVEEIETFGCDFDTDYHEAVTAIPASSDKQKNKIIDCVQKGYKINNKIVRHSKVIVGI